MDDARFDEVADRLHGLPPGEFTAERDRLAQELRSSGDRATAAAVRALRRPTAAAWAVNLIVRERRDDVEALLVLGEGLREAQSALSGADLRRLGKQQHQVVTAMRKAAQAITAGREQALSDTVVRGVENTLRAALADPRAADEVRAGRLSTELDPAGFGPLADGSTGRPEEGSPTADGRTSDDDGGAAPGEGSRGATRRSRSDAAGEAGRTRKARREVDERAAAEARAAAAARLREAESAHAAATSAVTDAERVAAEARDRQEEREVRTSRLETRVHELEAELVRLREELTAAQQDVERGTDEVEAAVTALDAARASLEAAVERRDRAASQVDPSD